MKNVAFPIEGVSYPNNEEAARYMEAGAWVEENAGDVLRSMAVLVPEKVALVSESRRMTYAEFDSVTERLGAALAGLGLCPGDRALFQMGTVIETAISLFACFKAGVVPVCSLPQHREIEMRELARQSEAKLWFVQADYSAFDLVSFATELADEFSGLSHIIVARGKAANGALRFDHLIEGETEEHARRVLSRRRIGVGDVLTFQLSGGTTGTPKIIPRFHGEYLGQARDWARRTSMDAGMVALYAMPLIHNAGQIASLFPSVLLGGTMILMQRMNPEVFFDWVVRERVTHSTNIGPAVVQMIDYANVAGYDLSSIKLMTQFDRSDLLESQLNVPCANIFGITEGTLMCSEPGAIQDARFRTVGHPVSNVDEVRLLVPSREEEVQLGEIGELCIKGPSTTRGYFRLPEVNRVSFTSDGFFRTGDLMRQCYVGSDVCCIFVGRIKDNIDRGGEKFGAEEVENLIVLYPHVADAKVVAMPDKMYGEKACAFLMMRQGKSLPAVSELGEFLVAKGLARFKLPERIESIEVFPVTRVGKLDKAELRKMITDKLVREGQEI